MKSFHRLGLALTLAAFACAAQAQDASSLSKCLGKGFKTYAKVFEDRTTTKNGAAVIGKYKAGGAEIVATQSPGSAIPDHIVANFYGEPNATWQKDLEELGLSSKDVRPIRVRGRKLFRLLGVHAGKVALDVVWVAKDPSNFGNPTVRINVRR